MVPTVYLASYVLAVVLGHLIVVEILKKYRVPETGLKGAGAAIGVLERILTLTLILIGEYTAIAVVFTAKSITRFEELKNREFAEYYLIGTLSSLLFSTIIGLLTKWLLDTVSC